MTPNASISCLRRAPLAAALLSLLLAACGDRAAMPPAGSAFVPTAAPTFAADERDARGGPPPGAALPMRGPDDMRGPAGRATAGARPSEADAALDGLMAWERQDMGVAAPPALHDGEFHGPTPNRIPGGQVITTQGLVPLLQQGVAVHVFDVLGAAQTLPRAVPAAWAAQGGSFDDATQQQFAQLLQQVTRGQADAPLVFYCGGPQCWMSYNAAARAIRLGYRNVLWYRGGLQAWQRAGLPLAQAQGQMPMQGGMPMQRGMPMQDGAPMQGGVPGWGGQPQS